MLKARARATKASVKAKSSKCKTNKVQCSGNSLKTANENGEEETERLAVGEPTEASCVCRSIAYICVLLYVRLHVCALQIKHVAL